MRDRGPAVRAALLTLTTVAWLPSFAAAQAPRVVRDFAAELACGPQVVEALPADPIRLAGGPVVGKAMFGGGDKVVVHAGSTRGLKPGQQYFVRRMVADRFTPSVSDNVRLYSEHTAGWIRITDVQADAAAATVVHACDSIEEGDYLEPFVLPAVPAAAAPGTADFDNPGRLILADERRQLGSAGSLMVLDRGADHGLRPGQRITIFRPWPSAGPVLRVGEATAMIVGPERSTVRIDQSSDAIYVGDLAAIQR